MPAVYEKIKNDRLTFPSDIVISAELRDLISKMLEKDPSKRITLPMIKVCSLIHIFSHMNMIFDPFSI